MHVALVIIGAFVGLVLGSQSSGQITLFAVIVGGIRGEIPSRKPLASSRARNSALEREVGLSKERLSALWRRQRESGAGNSSD